MKKRKRIHPKRENGIFDKRAPYWIGERAEDIVSRRMDSYRPKPKKKKKQ